MAAAYGLDVRDPGLSLPRFWRLLSNLPPAARRPGEEWSVEAELLALACDHLANLTWVIMRANGAKNAPRPRPLPRPPGARPQRGRPGRAASGPDGRQISPAAPGKAASWADAARQLAAIPGVVVTDDG